MQDQSLYIGLMSGTSMDSIDAGLFDIGDDRCLTLATHSEPYPPELRERLLAASRQPHNCTIDEVGALDTWVGRAFATAASALINNSSSDTKDIRAIGSHGQTLRHQPHAGHPFTLQIGDPNVIAVETGLTTVADFRRKDLALGGEGAPLATAFHAHFLASGQEHRVVLNIGGIANITMLPADNGTVSGFDTGPGNTLLDAWIQSRKHLEYDRDGQWASSGSVVDELLERLLDDPYFDAPAPKSTGFEYFNMRWLQAAMAATDRDYREGGENVQATLVLLTAITIADAIHRTAPQTQRVLVCGGGVRNPVLMQCLGKRLDGVTVGSTAEYGVEPGWVEAATFAWLARQRLEGNPGNLPSVTGAEAAAVLGGIWYGG